MNFSGGPGGIGESIKWATLNFSGRLGGKFVNWAWNDVVKMYQPGRVDVLELEPLALLRKSGSGFFYWSIKFRDCHCLVIFGIASQISRTFQFWEFRVFFSGFGDFLRSLWFSDILQKILKKNPELLSNWWIGVWLCSDSHILGRVILCVQNLHTSHLAWVLLEAIVNLKNKL